MPKVLFIATVDVHFRAFHLPILQWFQERGWEVHVAANSNNRFNVSGVQGFNHGKAAGFKVSKFQGFKVSENQGGNVSGLQGFNRGKAAGFKVSGEQKNSVKQAETSETSETLKRLETSGPAATETLKRDETIPPTTHHSPLTTHASLPFCNHFHQIPFARSPFAPANLKAYRQLKRLIDSEQFDLIHCHTPVGGLLGRLAARGARKRGTKVFYTAHGFHFCKGAPLLNWLLFYPAERFLARFTDCLVTITEEDYHLATTHHFPAREITHVPGVGVDTERFAPLGGDQGKTEVRGQRSEVCPDPSPDQGKTEVRGQRSEVCPDPSPARQQGDCDAEPTNPKHLPGNPLPTGRGSEAVEPSDGRAVGQSGSRTDLRPQTSDLSYSASAQTSDLRPQTSDLCPPFPTERARRRAELGFGPDDILLIYAAEFNKNKNQQFLIRAVAEAAKTTPNLHLLLAGTGPLLSKCQSLAQELGLRISEPRSEIGGLRSDEEGNQKSEVREPETRDRRSEVGGLKSGEIHAPCLHASLNSDLRPQASAPCPHGSNADPRPQASDLCSPCAFPQSPDFRPQTSPSPSAPPQTSDLRPQASVHFLGYRNDLDRLLPLCDIAVASSLREGLPVNVMEAMACGLPVVATANRGHGELIEGRGLGSEVRGRETGGQKSEVRGRETGGQKSEVRGRETGGQKSEVRGRESDNENRTSDLSPQPSVPAVPRQTSDLSPQPSVPAVPRQTSDLSPQPSAFRPPPPPGFIVQPNNPHAMAERLHRLATDSALRQAMGTAGRQRVVENYALPVVTKQLTELYVRTLTG